MSEENKKERDTARFGTSDMGSGASRARNRTVLLTPETVGKVRSAISEEEEAIEPPAGDPMSELLPPMSWDYAEPRSESGEFGQDVRGYEPVGKRPTGKFASQPVSRPNFGPAPALAPPSHQSAPVAPLGKPYRPPSQSMARPELEARPHRAPARSKLIGFFVSYDREAVGEVYEIRVGRWLLTSRPTDHSEYILVPDESISPLHAIIRGTGEGKIQILDQLSEFGTGVIRAGSDREEEVVSSMITVAHGDVVRFGKRYFTVCVVPDRIRIAEES